MYLHDLGQDPATNAFDETVKKARETVSPWLWIFSIVGFGMAILNTRRIARMYSSWKGKK